MLLEPEEDCVQLQQLDVGEGLLEIEMGKTPNVAVPLGNHTKHDIVLPRKSLIGSIQPIKKIVETDSPTKKDMRVQSATTLPAVANCLPSLWQPPVDLSHLGEEQREMVKKILYEESPAFARDANDIGCIPSLQMSLMLCSHQTRFTRTSK